MSERDLCKNIIEFSFIAKSQFHSKSTEVLRSILAILIMEAEDTLHELNEINSKMKKIIVNPHAENLYARQRDKNPPRLG